MCLNCFGCRYGLSKLFTFSESIFEDNLFNLVNCCTNFFKLIRNSFVKNSRLENAGHYSL